MQLKAGAILITGILLLLVVLPVSAYDYQGVPVQGANTQTTTDQVSDILDTSMSSLNDVLQTTDFASLFSLIITLILGLLGISST